MVQWPDANLTFPGLSERYQAGFICPYEITLAARGDLPCVWADIWIGITEVETIRVFVRVQESPTQPMHTNTFVSLLHVGLGINIQGVWSRHDLVMDWAPISRDVPLFQVAPAFLDIGDVKLSIVPHWQDIDDPYPDTINRTNPTPWESCPPKWFDPPET